MQIGVLTEVQREQMGKAGFEFLLAEGNECETWVFDDNRVVVRAHIFASLNVKFSEDSKSIPPDILFDLATILRPLVIHRWVG